MAQILKKLSLVVLVAAVILPLGACNTLDGIGRDARAAGEAISNAARDNKRY